jgi:hypothetical protein
MEVPNRLKIIPGVIADSSRVAPCSAVRNVGAAGVVTVSVTSALRLSPVPNAVTVTTPR